MTRLLICCGLVVLAASCTGPSDVADGDQPTEVGGAHDDGDHGTGAPPCPDADTGISLPDGFCATVFADNLGRARHIAVREDGDVFVTIAPPRGEMEGGRIVALRDLDADGKADVQEDVLPLGGNGIAYADGKLYLGLDDRILRYSLSEGSLLPERGQTVIGGLPADGDHTAKTVVVVGNELYFHVGSASNSCQVANRELHSPGIDPCPELCDRAGVWKVAANGMHQGMSHANMVATGIRNGNALAYDADHRMLWSAINGRDQLHENWPELFTPEEDLLRPAEELVMVRPGDDYGWPYCYYDPFLREKVLAPEYGGDGMIVGRCATMDDPAAVLPAHWAPLDMKFYDGTMFPEHYRGGLFVSNHGSRFDMQAMFDPGYNVVFMPFVDGRPVGHFEHFAVGFPGPGMPTPLPEAAIYRPVGIAMMPDGSMLIGDDKVGRIWRVVYAAD